MMLSKRSFKSYSKSGQWLMLFLLLMLGLNSKSQNISADLDSIIRVEFSNYPHIPGMVVGVQHPIYGRFILPFGVRLLGDTTAISPDAIFSTGSVNKNLMWVLMHRLHQDGILDIYEEVYFDEPEGDEIYVNQLQDTIHKYTGHYFSIADLMRHTTGMVNVNFSNNFPYTLTNNIYKQYELPEILNHLFNTTESTNECDTVISGICQDFIFGVDHSYSSYGPMIASVIAEMKTGKNARQLEREYIFTPLQMTSSSHLAYDDPIQNLTPGHGCTKDTLNNCTSEYGATDWYNDDGTFYWHPITVASIFRYPFYSTVADLLTYTNAQFNDSTFLLPSTVDAMQNEFVLQYNIFRIGLGIINYEYLWSTSAPEDNFWGHTGSGTLGHGSSIAHRDFDHLNIVILINVNPFSSEYGQTPYFNINKAIGAYFLGL